MSPSLPLPRGPLSRALIAHLVQGSPLAPDPATAMAVDARTDDDLQLALWCCYELHYHGFEGIDPALEWEPEILAFRANLEARFEAALRDDHSPAALPTDPCVALRLISTWAGPPLARTVEQDGGIGHLRELAIHRSAYQLKEADPHTWGIPRLSGRGRSAMIAIQADEYGSGRRGDAHAEIFAAAMRDLGLDDRFGHYVDRLPGTTLATDNLVSMFGLNRRLRGALVGHLALFEMCSVVPMGRYLTAARGVGGLPALERFYEVHVEADFQHARLALDEMVASFARDEPDLAPDMIFGAAALSHVESRMARAILRAWDDGRSSLLDPRPDTTAGPPPPAAKSGGGAGSGSQRDRGRQPFPVAALR
ncbi:MAG TPA: iron-containing redox enzyme family protein [Acidimicrobiales bacterium]